MSVAAPPTPASPFATGGRLVPVSGALVRRSLQRVVRIPAAFLPSLVMPVFQAIAFSGAFGFAIKTFGIANSLDWFVPLAALQGASFGAIGVSLSLINDLQTGYFERLRLAPISRWSLIAGPLGAALARSTIPVALVLVVGALGGMNLPGGVAGVGVLAIAALGIAFIAGGWGLGLAYRIRSMAAASLMQFGVFITIFLSTAQAPLGAMRGWARHIARFNPITNILRMSRQGFVGDVTWHGTWPGLVAIVGLAITSTWWARRGLSSLDR